MLTKLIVLLFIFNKLNAASLNLQPLVPSEDYTHSAIIDEVDKDLYRLFWKFNNDEIQFEVHCRTVGWVGLGLSPNGAMTGADIAIGWVSNTGESNLKDTHATGFVTPITDNAQDWVLIGAKEENGYTILKMKRKLNTCDKENDIEIKEETNYLIVAWNDEDPVTGNNDWKYHDVNRRIKVEYLLNFRNETLVDENTDLQNALNYTYRLNNLQIPPKRTFYWCQMVQLPQYDVDTQLISYEILIDNLDMGHHLLVYVCPTVLNLDPVGSVGAECGSVQPPPYMQACLISPLIISWAIGGQKNFAFPKDTGLPLKSSARKQYVLFEYHFDNPKSVGDRRDSSGVRLYYTPNLRKYDVGVITLGTPGEITQGIDIVIPPRVENFKVTSTCYPECTTRFFPQNGITVFTGFLHTHLAGRAVRTKLVRNDKVVKHLIDNPKYDFSYQFNIEIEPYVLHRGDMLITECVFSGKNRSDATFWGYSTEEEMCFNFMYYYPKIDDFDKCLSRPSPLVYCNFFKQLTEDKLIPEVYCNPLNLNQTFIEIATLLKNITFTDELGRRFKEFYDNPKSDVVFCGDALDPLNGILGLIKPFPTPTELPPVPDTCRSMATRLYGENRQLLNVFILILASLFSSRFT